MVQVVNEANNEVVYTLRIKGNSYQPGVFEEGTYTIKVGEGKDQKTITEVEPIKPDEFSAIEIIFQ